jgi:hypothetical protein
MIKMQFSCRADELLTLVTQTCLGGSSLSKFAIYEYTIITQPLHHDSDTITIVKTGFHRQDQYI